MSVQSIDHIGSLVSFGMVPKSLIDPGVEPSSNVIVDAKKLSNDIADRQLETRAPERQELMQNPLSGLNGETEARQNRALEQVLTQLKTRDQEVKAHEAAHLHAAGGYARGGMSFSYQTGPDGQKYAIGGEVGIDVSPIAGDPQKTLEKARQVHAAALAPAQPSTQDFRVAAQAMQMQQQALMEMREAAQSDIGRMERQGFETRQSFSPAD
ncbi:putative metalloprotease CJM1_0395 family protein [Thiomicrorhabdus sp.]|uniref:putative metalloprotease CJM1_0395 family protein n=1 Tax=Thiomicrorhabdus sp. TaxID=2039724 RepID=UPI0029C8A58D|nr:putative metalloprotease CJM1_0395 family protein [Thiomicrorhabdus sp.]